MKITILCSSADHPVNSHLEEWVRKHQSTHQVDLVRSRSELSEGDFLFLISCSEIIKSEHRAGYRHVLVLHASDLPIGRGWSPHVWELVGGGNQITLSLLEAEDAVDTGGIWQKVHIPIKKSALWHEVNEKLFSAEMELMAWALNNAASVKPYSQNSSEASYYRRRKPDDSEVDPNEALADQFDLIRMCDPERYPAWFEVHGQKYKIVLEKLNNE